MTSARTNTIARAAIPIAMLAVPMALLQAPTVRASILSLAEAMHTGSWRSYATYFAAASVASLCTAPLWLLGALAGYAYGFPYGVFRALPAVVTGATLCCLLGRFMAHSRVGALLRENARFKLIEQVIHHDGTRIATLLRLSPVMPQNLLHYALGVARLPVAAFVGSTALGLVPMICAQVYVGSLLRDATEIFREGTVTWQVLAKGAAGLVITAVLVTVVVRRSKRALDAAMAVKPISL
jgi:uncharacterized membrane protein YdjX (TVP38/TMEM64 family)